MVRQICCDVADRGEPIENFFHDREFAADLLTGYYTDYEPQSSFVAESQGNLIGYVNGCADNHRYGLVMIFLIAPWMIVKGIQRGVFGRREFWRIIRAMFKNWRWFLIWRKKSFHSHQGHMHIGVAKDFRGQQVGERLVDALLNYAKERKVDRMTASVHDGNKAACRFFERLGFSAQERYPMVMAYGDSLQNYHSIFYVKTMV
ncbi:MAG: GNAT family N-acetyltransferase [Candidatus Omnitrophica bacterium]|nr:GNAT family N-acetyltransferase [Candidatus Omnitrophota bacterium]